MSEHLIMKNEQLFSLLFSFSKLNAVTLSPQTTFLQLKKHNSDFFKCKLFSFSPKILIPPKQNINLEEQMEF